MKSDNDRLIMAARLKRNEEMLAKIEELLAQPEGYFTEDKDEAVRQEKQDTGTQEIGIRRSTA